jgi:hypothetical protein
MTTYTVIKVRKELSADGRHRHLAGVITTENLYYTRREVVDSIDAGNTWQTSAGGYSAKIHKLNFCPKVGCFATPYIATNPDSRWQDNLENLPES